MTGARLRQSKPPGLDPGATGLDPVYASTFNVRRLTLNTGDIRKFYEYR